ncbi:MAG: tape measure protein [Lachnospiraceae bacterium]|nr:tape measure protein [Lachnospiraceae bacterium]
MAESFSVKAILSAADSGFSSVMKSASSSADSLKSTLTSGLGFGVLMGVGQKAFSVITSGIGDLTKETIGTSDSMQKLQQAMRFSGSSEKEIQRIAGATGSLKTYADKTVFSLNDVMSTFGSLSANGVKDADRITESVGNAVAVFGGGAKEFSSVGLAFSQAMASGALHAQDWNQIINASPQLAGGLRKELIRLNPVLGGDFKGAMENGAVTADLLAEAMNNIGMTDMAKDAAQSVTTFEGAMGNFEATVSNGIMNIYDSFAKSSIVDAINGMNTKVGSGLEWLANAIPVAIDKIAPYWNVFKNYVIEVKDAFGGAVSSIVKEVSSLTGAFGSTESVNNFADVLGIAKDGLVGLAGIISDNSDTIVAAIPYVAGLALAFKGFQVVKAVAPFVGAFTGAIGQLASKGLGGLAAKLFGTAAAEKATGAASASSSGQVLSAAAAFLALGAGVVMIATGFYILATAAANVASAGPVAIGVLVGMVAAVVGLAAGAAALGPALSAGAIGFVAFGAAVLLAGAGMMLLSTAAINLAAAGTPAIACMVGMVAAIALLAVGAAALGPALIVGGAGLILFGAGLILVATAAVIAGAGLNIIGAALPTVVQYGASGAVAMIQLGAGLVVLGAGALVAGAGCVVLGAGLIVVAAGLALVGVAVLVAAAGVLALGAGALLLGAALMVAGAAVTVLAAALPATASGAMAAGAGLTMLLGVSILLAAAMVALGAGSLVATVGVVAFGVAMIAGSAGTLVMAAALVAVNSSMKSIALNAKTTQSSLSSMNKSVDVVGSGLDAVGEKAKSAMNALTSAFDNSSKKALDAGTKIGTGFITNLQSGLSPAPSVANTIMSQFNAGISAGGVMAAAVARSASASVVSALGSAAGGAYGCGYNIGAGLANGMRASLGAVQSTAAQLAAAAEAAIRAKAQIHSPSRVSDKLGGYYGTGFANGILSKVKEIKAASLKLFNIPDMRIPQLELAYSGGYSGDLNDEYSYSSNETYTIYVPVEIEGREVAKATATYTKEELGKIEKRSGRKQGCR